MWYLERIVAKDFMSYEELDYEFKTGVTTLIYGVNRDEMGADSNGSGKSAIIKAITIALLDMPDKSLTKEQYISDWSNSSKLELYLKNEVHNQKLVIHREYKRNKDSIISVFENGVLNDKLTSIGECNKRILQLIDISREDILNYFIINQDNSNSFFEATDSSQKATITRFVNADLVDKSISAVQADIESKNKEISVIQDSMSTINTKIELLSQQIEYEKNERMGDLKQEKEKYEEKVVSLQAKIVESKAEAGKYKESLSKLEIELSELEEEVDEEAIEGANLKLKKSKKTKEEYEESISELSKSIAKIKNIMAGEIKCPKCGHTWVESEEGKTLKELDKEKKEYEALIEQIKEASKNIENRISKLRNKISHSNTQMESLETLRAEISRNKRKLTSTKQAVEDYSSEIKIYSKKISDIANSHNSTVRVANLEKEIDELSEELSGLTNDLMHLNEEKNDLTYWNINLGIKGFKTFLVNKTLLSVEGYVNMYLSKFKTDLIFRIQGFKTLKTGEIRENIDISISRDGGDTWKPFKRHSGGQRRRIDVCGILTVQSFINNSSKYGGLDLLVLDEFFEGLDTKGQQRVLWMLEKTNITTLVISHNNNDIGAENCIWAIYENKTSRLSNEKREFGKNQESNLLSSGKKKISKNI